MRLWVFVGILVGAALAALAVYFLPERETLITRDVVFEDVRDKAAVFGPLVNDFKRK
jgi:hypothetical protein